MAAIDKIYLTNWEEYSRFSEWCKVQPKLKDKYGKEGSLTSYLYSWKEENWKENDCHPVFNAPYYVDAYIIRNCPLDFIQKELMINYGHWSQERIKNFYEDVKNWKGEGECPYWAKLEDFIELEDGSMTIRGLEKSDYERIKDGELYTTPKREDYEYGKHFRCIKHPKEFYNRPFRCGSWFVDVETPDDMGLTYMWYHEDTNTWDFADEYIISGWSSSTAFVKTIKALKRHIRKWKLPVGTKVRATGRYVGDDYEFIITK